MLRLRMHTYSMLGLMHAPTLPMLCTLHEQLKDMAKAAKAQMATRQPVVWRPNSLPLDQTAVSAFTASSGLPVSSY